MQHTRNDRIAPRVPFFAHVIASGLQHCTATNLSVGGMGLTGQRAAAAKLCRGDDLEVEFPLHDAQPMRAIARIAWTSRVRADGHVSFGVQFREISSGARGEISRFVTDHRPRVLIALASQGERALAVDALEDLELEFVDSAAQLTTTKLHTYASILLFAHDAAELRSFVDGLWASRTADTEIPIAPISLCTEMDSDSVLPLLAQGEIYIMLRPPFDRNAIGLAVARSCERWALQLEVRWSSLQLEGIAVQQIVAAPRAPESSYHSAHVVRISAAMQRVYTLIETVAAHDVPVLLNGETGTGKELAARAIHAASRRAKTPFVAQDCGALTETLLESELFGHVRGAFTGATADHPGLFQIADGGTIFLDEIQNTSPALQAKLLRVCEEGEVRPVGGARPRRVNVRLIAACNVDLRQAVKDQRFRADFFYRLNRFPVEIPPLREHFEDIVPLATHFVSTLCETMQRPVVRIEPRMERALLAYRWPGNIRELRNAIERALLLTAPDEPLRWETLPAEVRSANEPRALDDRTLDSQLEEFERQVIQSALERNEGVIRRAARELDVNAVTLARKMRYLGLK